MKIMFEMESNESTEKMVVLRKDCSFESLYERERKSVRRPEEEEAYSRSDYKDHWWTTWFPVYPSATKEQIAEINEFQKSLLELPEFLNLEQMTSACKAGKAQPTKDPAEFNLFSETENFNIWIRMITRYRDYNLYVHYYRKQG